MLDESVEACVFLMNTYNFIPELLNFNFFSVCRHTQKYSYLIYLFLT